MLSQRSGFTLIETLVAIMVTGIVLSSALTHISNLAQGQSRALDSRSLGYQANFALQRMADKFREKSLDYSLYESGEVCGVISEGNILSTANAKLCLQGGTKFFLEKDSETEDESLWMEEAGSDESSDPLKSLLLPPETMVKRFWLMITPVEIPGEALEEIGDIDPTTLLQPKATIFLEIASRRNPEKTVSLQTTVSSRKYGQDEL